MKLFIRLYSIAVSVLLAEAFAPNSLPTKGLITRNVPNDAPLAASSARGRTFQIEPLKLSTLPLAYPNGNPFRGLKKGASKLVRSLKTNEVSRWRAAAATFISSIFIFRPLIDSNLEKLWTYLITSSSIPARIFRTDSYEWVLAVSAFGVFIHFFGYADRVVRQAAEEGRPHPWRKYRLQDRYEADKRRRLLDRRQTVQDAKQLQVQDDNDKEELSMTVEQTKWNWNAWKLEFWVYVLPLLTWDILSPRRHRRLAAFAAPNSLQIMRDVTGGLLMYDLLFFTGHLIMHKVPFLYRTLHRKHHDVQEVRAGDVVRLSVFEEVLEVGFSIVALNALGAHPLARSIYNLIIVFLLTELHCGFDFPWTPQNVVPFGLATGSRRHHYHHRIGKHYYQKFFHHVDRIFGFFQKNDGSLLGDSVEPNPYIPPSWK